ncbi:MAG: DUF4350 domain-containing protein [Thermoleophilia bacterium]|nr:DUF4350 domain-containing protein [Thermoleophilia bacterium]
MTRGWKIGLSIAAGIVALNLLLAALRAVTGSTPGGPASSAYATGPDGAAAYATLLSEAGHDVVHERATPHAAQLEPGDTAVVLDPPFVLRQDERALRSFLLRGGRLIASPGDSNWLERLVPQGPAAGGRGVARARPLAPVPEVRAVSTVATAGDDAWVNSHGALPVLGDADSSVLAIARAGAGRALLLADTSPLQNAYLGRADNAQFAAALGGPPRRRVVFFEAYHGYGQANGLSAVPGRWKLALLLGAGAALVFMLARGRRLGPPEDEARAFAPARREYVDAVAATLARTREPREALAAVHEELRTRVVRRASLRADASVDDLAAAASRLGLAADEVQTLRPDAPFDELALGRAFARTAEGRRSAWRT